MYGLEDMGITNPGEVRRNWPVARLVEHELRLDGGRMGPRGAVMVDTGIYTGRSPNDRFIVDEPTTTDKLWWGPVNRKVSEKVFDHLLEAVVDYYNHDPKGRGIYLFDGRCGKRRRRTGDSLSLPRPPRGGGGCAPRSPPSR